MSEPGSVPDGETLQNADVARLKRKSWDMEVIGGYPRKRYGDGLVWNHKYMDALLLFMLLHRYLPYHKNNTDSGKKNQFLK